nr:PREDICTED: signal-induced proliferation-associated 1-like protein 3 [Latimeria chalumnae]|eukprot:XP_014348558.1 PREDICTED: signal-induced proliferation-associated 1-like protein 3 [Latimeria chalumnae]
MTSYKCLQDEAMELGGTPVGVAEVPAGIHISDYYPLYRVQNGSAVQLVPTTNEGASRLSTTPIVPKMGVRARIADWPPKRDVLKELVMLSPPREVDHLAVGGDLGLPAGYENGQFLPSNQDLISSSIYRGIHRPLWKRAKDVEFQDGWLRSPAKGFAPLRNRSNSELTLSEYDADGAFDPRGTKHVTLPLFREYGSTSSIDVQGISEQSFFEMLNEFRNEKFDQRSVPPEKLQDLLRVDSSMASSLNLAGSCKIDIRNGPSQKEDLKSLQKDKDKSRKKNLRGEVSSDSIFRKLRNNKSDNDSTKSLDQEDSRSQDILRPWVCQKSFAHFDAQSILFDLNEVAANRAYVAQRRNTATGASAASAVSLAVSRTLGLGSLDPTFTSTEDLNCKENLEPDHGDNNGNDLLLSCPHFRNEIGGMCERNISFSKVMVGCQSGGEGGFIEPSLSKHCTNASIAVLEVSQELQKNRQERIKHFSVEHVDSGARYYKDYFHGKEHSNYFGVDEKLGPVALSIKREKLEDSKDCGLQYQYRVIFRTSELITLRGSILEDAIPSTAKHGTVRGLPLKDVLEYVIPELNSHCLRLALNTPKVSEQLLKLDEQGLSEKHKVGILYCKSGQSTEEEMYNNEGAGPAFEEFLSLLGEKVGLKGFAKYAAQLDTKTDSTGTHSLYTTYQDYEIMFHVSTLLPYTPNNRQQLLRKRHIGNDIVTIIFQEPGALPFTPQNIRSHFQHVFVIVKVHHPCTDKVSYSVAVTRSKDVPPFGPPIPNGITFRRSDVFRDFLLAKLINAENAAHKSEKFHTMATRTRQEYLKDLAENCVTNTPIDSTGKFNLISLTSKKKEKTKARQGAELHSVSAITWRVAAQDFSQAIEIECFLGISSEFIVLIDQASKEVVFNCFCADVIGWTPDTATIKIFYGRGDHIFIRAPDNAAEDIKEIVQRLKVMTEGCETVDMTLRRNGLGQLGFHVKFDGTVAEVEEYGFAWQAGLRQGSRLVEICKVSVVTLNHDQMIDLLRTSVTVKVVIIPPHEDGTPRRGWSEVHEMNTAEHKSESEPVPAGCRPPYRSNTTWQWSGPASHNSSQPQKWAAPGHVQAHSRPQKLTSLVPYREPQPLQNKRPVSFPETPYGIVSPGGIDRVPPYRQPSGSFSTPGSGGSSYTRYKHSPDRRLKTYLIVAEPLWHVPASARITVMPGNNVSKRSNRQELASKDSPNRHSKGDAQYSSHSSSNTLSSNASSNDERWFDTPEHMETEQDPMAKGGSSDSGIDTTLYTPSPNSMASKSLRPTPQRDRPKKAIQNSTVYSGFNEYGSRPMEWTQQNVDKRKEPSTALNVGPPNKGYRPKMYGPPTSNMTGNIPSSTSDLFRQPSNLNPRHSYTPQGYKAPGLENPRTSQMTPSSSFQLSTSAPKSFYSSQPVRNKNPTGWKKPEETPTRPATFTDTKKQIDLSSKNVFGQPRLRASLRDLRSPRKNYKSTIEDDLKKLIIMDNPMTEQEKEMSQSPRKTLKRTQSDESICSGRRDASYANTATFEQSLHNDVLFTTAYPSSTLPGRRPYQQQGANICVSELSLMDAREKAPLRHIDPGMMPLPDTASGLEWSSLVNAAKAYEVQRAVSLFSLNESTLISDNQPACSPVQPSQTDLEKLPTPRTTPTLSEDPPSDLTGKVYQLEAMLKQLHDDLQKEKQDKVALQVEVASLRENNQRLQEESHSATEQLKKFAEIFSSAVEKK